MIDVAAMFSHAGRTFAGAAAGTLQEFHYRIAGRPVRIVYATPSIARTLSCALRHLETVEDDEPQLTIWAGDDASCGSLASRPLAGRERNGTFYCEGQQRAACDLTSGRIEAFDAGRRLGLFWSPDHSAMPQWDIAAPFLRILHWWAHTTGLQLVHGAAVATEDGGVLLAGPGGSGKSTTALSCIGTGIRYLADDYCMMDTSPPIHIHSVFCSGKADARSIALLPRLSEAFGPGCAEPGGKAIIYLADHIPPALQTTAALHAIALPAVSSEAEHYPAALSQMKALSALAPSTLLQLPGGRAQSLAQITAIIRAAKCWKLSVGPDPDTVHPMIRKIIRGNC